jgi:hypothetical protein
LVYSSIEPCAHIIVCFNISQSAGAYSSLAGLLAGFLVTAIVLILSNPPKPEGMKDLSLPLYAFIVAGVAFALSSFLFAQLVGYEITSIAYLLGFAAFGTFVLAILQLVLSLIWFCKLYGIPAAILSSINLLFQGVLVTGILYLFIFSEDILRLKAVNDQEAPWIFYILIPYVLLTYTVPWLGALFVRKKWHAKSGIPNAGTASWLYERIGSPEVSFKTTSACSGLLIVLIAFGFGLVLTYFRNLRSSFENINISVYFLILILVGLILPVFLFLVQLSLPKIKRKGEERILLSEP